MREAEHVGREQDSIEAIIAAQCAAWEAGDADAFAASVTDDVSFTNVMGMYTVGREPFRAHHARIFATIYKGSRMTQKVERIALIRDDVAVVDTLTGLEGVAHLPPGFAPGDDAPKARLQQVFAKDAGAWRVAAFPNVFVNPCLPRSATRRLKRQRSRVGYAPEADIGIQPHTGH